MTVTYQCGTEEDLALVGFTLLLVTVRSDAFPLRYFHFMLH